MPNALIELLAKQKNADASTKVPDLLRTAVDAKAKILKAETTPQTKVAMGDQGVAIKNQVPDDAPHTQVKPDTETTASSQTTN